MRNEGPYILEWIAWHRSIGFNDILILSNDCTDGSDHLLRHLASRNLIHHAEHHPEVGEFALNSAYRTARNHPLIKSADWVMALDADEFLVVKVGEGTVQSLINHSGEEFLGMAVHWKSFGDSGLRDWRDGMVRETYTRCAHGQHRANMRFKSIFRKPEEFGGFTSHAPHDFKGIWGGNNSWVDSNAQKLRPIQLIGKERRRATRLARIVHDAAQVNHYVVKCFESMAERREKWETSNRDTRYDDEFLELYNNSDEEDLSATQNTTRFTQAYKQLADDPETMRLHHATCAAYVSKLLSFSGADPKKDARYNMHIAKSQ